MTSLTHAFHSMWIACIPSCLPPPFSNKPKDFPGKTITITAGINGRRKRRSYRKVKREENWAKERQRKQTSNMMERKVKGKKEEVRGKRKGKG